MKILMIAPTPFFSHRGTHIRILEEARSLERLGHDITIVTYHIGDEIADHIDTKIDVRRIRRWLFWYKKTEAGPDWQKVLLNLFLIKKTFYLIRTKNPDVVHAHLHEGVLIARLMRMIFFWKKIKFVSDYHGSLVGEMRSHGYLGVPPIGTVFRAMERWINSMGDVAVVSGEENVEVIADAREDKKAHHVCDGVDRSAYGNNDSKKQLRKKYGIPEDAFVVVYTGALIANKGISRILEAIPFVIKKLTNIHFVIGGFPAERIINDVKSRELEKYVTVISPLNYFSLAEVNQLGDVAIDPKDASVRQASGKLLQYMAARMGIICADRQTNRKYLRDESAIFISGIDAHAITAAIERYYNDRDFLEKSADNAYEDAGRYDWSRIGKQLEELYENN